MVSKWDFFIGFILLLYYIKILRERERDGEKELNNCLMLYMVCIYFGLNY